MLELKNYATHDIVIDNVKIPPYGTATFSNIIDLSEVSKWVNRHKLSIQHVSAEFADEVQLCAMNETASKIESAININVDNKDVEKPTLNDNVIENDKNSHKRKKNRDGNIETSKINVEKGEMTDATD
jgi:hypothetical protein